MKSKKNTNTYRYELKYSYKVEDDSWFESQLIDTLKADGIVDAYSRVNEIIENVNALNDGVSFTLSYIEKIDD